MNHLVFTYGTLKHGYANNRLLANATFLGHAITKERYTLIDRGFPVAFRDGDAPVLGEAYLCDDAALAACDRLEGCPGGIDRGFYARTQTDLTLVGIWCGGFVCGSGKAFIYTMAAEKLYTKEKFGPRCPIQGGCYVWERRPHYG